MLFCIIWIHCILWRRVKHIINVIWISQRSVFSRLNLTLLLLNGCERKIIKNNQLQSLVKNIKIQNSPVDDDGVARRLVPVAAALLVATPAATETEAHPNQLPSSLLIFIIPQSRAHAKSEDLVYRREWVPRDEGAQSGRVTHAAALVCSFFLMGWDEEERTRVCRGYGRIKIGSDSVNNFFGFWKWDEWSLNTWFFQVEEERLI